MSTYIMSNGHMGTTQHNDRQTTVRACSHRVKANAKVKKIKEQSEEIKKNKQQTSKKIFAFAWCGQIFKQLPSHHFICRWQ